MSNNRYGKGRVSPVSSDYGILTKLLYKYEVCESYILYGEYLEGGGNRAAAFDVYKKGTEMSKCSGWFQSILGGKISLMKNQIIK